MTKLKKIFGYTDSEITKQFRKTIVPKVNELLVLLREMI